MSWRKTLFSVLAAAVLLLPRPALACPSCADAVTDTSGADAVDQERESAAYNRSIYLMVGMPYLLLGGLGLMIYRGYRRQAKEFAQRTADAETGGNGHVLPPLPANPSEDIAPGG